MFRIPIHTTQRIDVSLRETTGTPEPLSNFSFCRSTDHGGWYIFGGRKTTKRGYLDEHARRTLYEYDPMKGSFKVLSRNPKKLSERYWSTMIYRSNGPSDPCLIVFGGFCVITMSGYQELTISEELFEFNLIKKKWKRLTYENPPLPLAAHTAVYQKKNDQMIVFGGSCRATTESGEDDQFTTFDIYICDFRKERWTQVDYHRDRQSKVVPSVRYGHSMNWVNEFLQSEFVIFGGSHMELKKDYNDTWVFHIKKIEWTRLDLDYVLDDSMTDLNASTGSLSRIPSIENEFTIKLPPINGRGGSFSSPKTTRRENRKEMEEGDQSPTTKIQVPPPRRFHGSIVIRLRLYIYGGITSKTSVGIKRTRSVRSYSNLQDLEKKNSSLSRRDGKAELMAKIKLENKKKQRSKRQYFNDLWCFNIVTKKWKLITLRGEEIPRPVCGIGSIMGFYHHPKELWTILFSFGGDTKRGSTNKLFEFDIKVKALEHLHFFNPSTLYELDEKKMRDKERIWNLLKRRLAPPRSESSFYENEREHEISKNKSTELEMEVYIGLQDQFDRFECYECSMLDPGNLYPIFRKGELFLTPTHIIFYSAGFGDRVIKIWDYMKRVKIIEEIVEEMGEFPVRVKQRRKITFIMKNSARDDNTTILSQMFSTSTEDDVKKENQSISIRKMLSRLTEVDFERQVRRGGGSTNEMLVRKIRKQKRRMEAQRRQGRKKKEEEEECRSQFGYKADRTVLRNRSERLIFSDFAENTHKELVEFLKSLSLGIVYINRGFSNLNMKKRGNKEKSLHFGCQVTPKIIARGYKGVSSSFPFSSSRSSLRRSRNSTVNIQTQKIVINTSASVKDVKKTKKKKENKNYWKQEKESLIRSLNSKSFEITSLKNQSEALKKEMRDIDLRMKKVLTKLTSELNEKKRLVETLGSRNHQLETMISQMKKERKIMVKQTKEMGTKNKKLEISNSSLSKKIVQQDYIFQQKVQKLETKIEGLERKVKQTGEEYRNLKSSLRTK